MFISDKKKMLFQAESKLFTEGWEKLRKNEGF